MFRSENPVESEDIVLGLALSEDQQTVISVPLEEQQHHAMIWGRSGSGKSRLLQSLFLQHLSKGHGVCLIEPHHDLAFDTMAYLADRGYFHGPEAFDRLIYLDWGNGAIVPFNVLATNHYPPKTIALQTLEAMIRVWPELRRAPAFQTAFLASMVVLIQNHLPLPLLHDFLADASFRDHCLRSVTDPLILQSTARLSRLSAQEAGSAVRRAFLLSFNDVMRLSLGQPDMVLDIRQIMDEGRSLIVNLGNVPDGETRRLLGALLLVQIEQAALSRTGLQPRKRRPWTVLIDEWPSFAAADGAIGTILDQTRKFGLRLYLAAQSTGQVGSDRLRAALENCGLTITFGVGRESAVEQARHLVTLDPLLYRPDTLTGRLRHISTSEQFEQLAQDLQHLAPQEAYVKFRTSDTIKIKTLHVRNTHPDPAELQRVLTTYRLRYQRNRHAAEARISHSPTGPAVRTTRSPFSLFAEVDRESSLLDQSN